METWSKGLWMCLLCEGVYCTGTYTGALLAHTMSHRYYNWFPFPPLSGPVPSCMEWPHVWFSPWKGLWASVWWIVYCDLKSFLLKLTTLSHICLLARVHDLKKSSGHLQYIYLVQCVCRKWNLYSGRYLVSREECPLQSCYFPHTHTSKLVWYSLPAATIVYGYGKLQQPFLTIRMVPPYIGSCQILIMMVVLIPPVTWDGMPYHLAASCHLYSC